MPDALKASDAQKYESLTFSQTNSLKKRDNPIFIDNTPIFYAELPPKIGR